MQPSKKLGVRNCHQSSYEPQGTASDCQTNMSRPSNVNNEPEAWDVVGNDEPSQIKLDATALDSTKSSQWDTQTFNSGSFLLPQDRNGDWRTEVAQAVTDPIGTAISLRGAVQWANVRRGVSELAEQTSTVLGARLNSAFEGADVPAMHDRLMNMIPRLPLPTMRQVSHCIDEVTDRAQDMMRSNISEKFLDQDLASDHLAFAGIMGKKARQALVTQGICKEWQAMPCRETIGWQLKLDIALVNVFKDEQPTTGAKKLFEMEPIWKFDADSKIWRLEMDTRIHEMIELPCGSMDSIPWQLKVPFELPESCWAASGK